MINREEKIIRIKKTLENLSKNEIECKLCPRECKINRISTKKGYCKAGNLAIISHSGIHFGEEPPLSGYYDCLSESTDKDKLKGSGTIFFAGCNLKCIFCQNYQISWEMKGREVSDAELADIMISLQERKALNINLVSSTHFILPILRALKIAYEEGLSIPVIYNSNGYESVEVIRNLKGIIDIYLPDLKYLNSETSLRFSGVKNYFNIATAVIKEMYSQYNGLELNGDIAIRGLIIRHLVLPGHVKETFKILEWIYSNLSNQVWLSIMSQYKPCYRAKDEISRKLSQEEYQLVVDRLEELGFENVFIQPDTFEEKEHLVPDFNREEPFPWSNLNN